MLALFAFAQSVSLSNHKRRTQCHNVNRNTLNSLRKISIDLQKWAPQEHVYFETSEIVFDNIEKHHLKLKQNLKQHSIFSRHETVSCTWNLEEKKSLDSLSELKIWTDSESNLPPWICRIECHQTENIAH